MARPLRFPFFRIGMLLVAGALMASLFEFYVGFGEMAADLSSSEPLPESREELGRFFYRKFLLTGSVATLLFWGGLAIALIGAAARAAGPHRARADA